MPKRMQPPDRIRRRDHRSSRERLLRAARELMAERGPEAITISEVAHRSALNRTTAYQHFRTRDELVAAVYAGLAQDVARMLVAPMPIGERIDLMARFFVEHPEVTQLTLHQLLSANPLPRDAWEQYLDELRRITSNAKAQPGVDVEMLGYVLMSVGILWPLLARAAHETPLAMERATERLAREVKRVLLFGVLRPEAWPDLAAEVALPDEST